MSKVKGLLKVSRIK